ncbi:hypothetical protein KFU94_70950 [Chloroflexi bacterium TSY]|nr:hypothetical protein [Chloroflexi bacterium TSY]
MKERKIRVDRSARARFNPPPPHAFNWAELRVNAVMAFNMAWMHTRTLLFGLVSISLIVAVMPGIQALVGRETINAVVEATNGTFDTFMPIGIWIGLSLLVAVVQSAVQEGKAYLSKRFGQELSFQVNLDTVRHATKLDLSHLEDPCFQDVLARARQNP